MHRRPGVVIVPCKVLALFQRDFPKTVGLAPVRFDEVRLTQRRRRIAREPLPHLVAVELVRVMDRLKINFPIAVCRGPPAFGVEVTLFFAPPELCNERQIVERRRIVRVQRQRAMKVLRGCLEEVLVDQHSPEIVVKTHVVSVRNQGRGPDALRRAEEPAPEAEIADVIEQVLHAAPPPLPFLRAVETVACHPVIPHASECFSNLCLHRGQKRDGRCRRLAEIAHEDLSGRFPLAILDIRGRHVQSDNGLLRR